MATITEDYVSFETAKLLKEKGFDSDEVGCCGGFYSERCYEAGRGIKTQSGQEVGIVYDDLTNSDLEYDEYLRPTLQMAMKWLREMHHIHVCPEYKTFFQERPKKIYHHWCNKIIGIGRCFRQGIQDLNELDSDYFYFRSCKTYHDTYEDACEECVEFALRNLIEKGGSNE